MLAAAEPQAIAERFGVDDQQVRRDHLISHVLAAIGAAAGESVIFFGGTALARSVLVEGRLSDAPPATLTVLTSAGFVAAKTAAWHDRRAARDLWDLWALAEGRPSRR